MPPDECYGLKKFTNRRISVECRWVERHAARSHRPAEFRRQFLQLLVAGHHPLELAQLGLRLGECAERLAAVEHREPIPYGISVALPMR